MSYNPYSLDGKTILVTGASSGIGRATAVECSRMGANVILTARNRERLEETLSMMEPGQHVLLPADLADEQQRETLAQQMPQLDGTVQCAGITHHVPFPFINREKMNEIFDINFQAPVLLTHRLVKTKKLGKNASIVFISSIAGPLCAYVGGSLYAAAKGAIQGIIKGMAVDLAPRGIRVNSVLPSMVETNILTEGTITAEQLREDLKNYPMGRYGKPEEIAWAVIYLLSDASKFVTGSGLIIDGGVTAKA